MMGLSSAHEKHGGVLKASPDTATTVKNVAKSNICNYLQSIIPKLKQ